MIGLALGHLVSFIGDEIFALPTTPGKPMQVLVMATPIDGGSVSAFKLQGSNDGEVFCDFTEEHASEAVDMSVGISYYSPPGRFVKVISTDAESLTITLT